LQKINTNGGVAINLFGEVAFLGLVGPPTGGMGMLPAVITQNGVIAKGGDTLPDGTHLHNINTNAGVAINIYGDVVFHGETDGVKAVFTQNGLVAKVNDIMDDGTPLWDIYEIAGVAINPYGSEVAFHGYGPYASAVFVGQAPLPPAPEGDETDSE
jgi:hypothetical protein